MHSASEVYLYMTPPVPARENVTRVTGPAHDEMAVNWTLHLRVPTVLIGGAAPKPRHLALSANSMIGGRWPLAAGKLVRTLLRQRRQGDSGALGTAWVSYHAIGARRKMPGRVPKRDLSRLGSRSGAEPSLSTHLGMVEPDTRFWLRKRACGCSTMTVNLDPGSHKIIRRPRFSHKKRRYSRKQPHVKDV